MEYEQGLLLNGRYKASQLKMRLVCLHGTISVHSQGHPISFVLINLFAETINMPEAETSISEKENLSYEIVRPNQLPQVHRMLYQSFHLDEPMTRHLKLHQVCKNSQCQNQSQSAFIPKGPFSIPDTDAMVDALVFDHNLSIMASDSDTKSPLAVMLNGIFHRDEIDMPRQEVGCKLKLE